MKTEGNYMNAIITFDEPEAIKDYHMDLWMAFIKGHALQVTPMSLTSEQKKQRGENTVMLSGFPSNINEADLLPIIQDLEIKVIHIPRQNYKYYQRP